MTGERKADCWFAAASAGNSVGQSRTSIESFRYFDEVNGQYEQVPLRVWQALTDAQPRRLELFISFRRPKTRRPWLQLQYYPSCARHLAILVMNHVVLAPPEGVRKGSTCVNVLFAYLPSDDGNGRWHWEIAVVCAYFR